MLDEFTFAKARKYSTLVVKSVCKKSVMSRMDGQKEVKKMDFSCFLIIALIDTRHEATGGHAWNEVLIRYLNQSTM